MNDAQVITVTMSAVAALLTAIVTTIVTNILSKKREHEADWRKLKFNVYQEYVSALSGVVNRKDGPSAEARERYANAFNTICLVAPPDVLTALKDFRSAIRVEGKASGPVDDRRGAVELSALFRAIRADVHPSRIGDDDTFMFELGAQ